jgi:hypothetical protein
MKCMPCPWGTFSRYPGSVECSYCFAGQELKADKTGCRNCAPMFYAPSSSYDSTSPEEKCQPCAQGSYSLEMADSCTACFQGAVNDDKTGCLYTFPTSTPTSKPTSITYKCVAGQFEENGVCTDCDAGYYSPSPDKPCVKCPRGSYSPIKGSNTCYVCPGGQIVNRIGFAKTSCEACQPSTYYPVRSPFLGYTNSYIPVFCIPCPPRMYSGSSESVCHDCPLGYEGNVERTGCVTARSQRPTQAPSSLPTPVPTPAPVTCTPGQYDDPTSHLCIDCLGGYYSPAPFIQCVPCLPGSYSEPKATGCLFCLGGTTINAQQTGCD